jgi:integrase/recombinase XerD
LLVCNKSGNRLTQAYISRIVENILISAGIRKEKNGAHMLRHTLCLIKSVKYISYHIFNLIFYKKIKHYISS